MSPFLRLIYVKGKGDFVNYIKEAENYLKYYRHLQKSLDNTEREINYLKLRDMPRYIKASQMEETEIRSMMGKDDAWNDIYKIIMLTECWNDTSKAMQNIDDVLDMISGEKNCGHYSRLLKLWYIDKWDKYEISEELHLSRRSVFYHKEEAIRSFAVALFGIKALKAV